MRLASDVRHFQSTGNFRDTSNFRDTTNLRDNLRLRKNLRENPYKYDTTNFQDISYSRHNPLNFWIFQEKTVGKRKFSGTSSGKIFANDIDKLPRYDNLSILSVEFLDVQVATIEYQIFDFVRKKLRENLLTLEDMTNFQNMTNFRDTTNFPYNPLNF